MSDGVTRCAGCRFFDQRGSNGRCRRHAPGPGNQPFAAARWPETHAADGCGDGEPRDHSTAEDRTLCRVCIFWHRPGVGIDPAQRGDHLRAWWHEAGYCRRYAPRPDVDIGHRAFWVITHGDEHCAEARRA